MENWSQKALCYAEKHGIIEYKVKGAKMIYTVTYPTEGSFRHVINLRDNREVITELKRRVKNGVYNRG
jgi:hypothetical protein